MTYSEEEYLMLSGLQHFKFCRRQWALIHIEHQWAENYRTIDGELLHERAHDKEFRESRGDLLVTRGMSVVSPTLGVSGECDVVEFRRTPNGVPLAGHDGLWLPYPVEYKRGRAREDSGDTLQLCGQAMCLEEMLCCDIPEGALYYGEMRHRQTVPLTPELRAEVRSQLEEMHDLVRRGHTPTVKPKKGCNACSMKDVCLPRLLRGRSAVEYLRRAMEETL